MVAPLLPAGPPSDGHLPDPHGPGAHPPGVRNRAVITHHKCASNWLRRIFDIACRACAEDLEVFYGVAQEVRSEGAERKVSLCVNGAWGDVQEAFTSGPVVHFVRDPRDAFVSQYFSWRHSHRNNDAEIEALRQELGGLDEKAGLLRLLGHFRMGRQLLGWPAEAHAYVTRIRYEDLLADFPATAARLLGAAGLDPSPELVEELARETSFRHLTGREPGTGDVTKHCRKGISGDWRNHFDPVLAGAFEERYGRVLDMLGYPRANGDGPA